MAIPIPAIPRVIVQDRLRMIQHHVLLDGITLHMQKSHIQHIEQPPVLRHCIFMGIRLQKIRNDILLFLCISIPDLLPADPEADHQRAGLHSLLKSPKGIGMAGNILLILIGADIERIVLGTAAQHLILIIFRHGIAANLQLREIFYHGRGNKEGTGQTLKNLRQPLGMLSLFGILKMRIGDLRLLSWHHHWILKILYVTENPFQHVPPGFQPAFSCQPGIRT